MKLLEGMKIKVNRMTDRMNNLIKINKLKHEMSQLEQEFNVHYAQMGRIFYEGYRMDQMIKVEKDMTRLCVVCDQLYTELKQIETTVAKLKDEQICECGYVCSFQANYCIKCGQKLGRDIEPNFFNNNKSEEDDVVDLLSCQSNAACVETAASMGIYPLEENQKTDLTEISADADQNNNEFSTNQLHSRWQMDTPIHEQIQRERERQQELDERIRYWKENNPDQGDLSAMFDEYGNTMNCNVCLTELHPASKWCPRCGSEQV